MSNADYEGLCLAGSKECARIHELVYTDLDDNAKMEFAHAAFSVLSFVGALGPMFIVNAWIGPQSTRYQNAIIENGFKDFWRISYLLYAIEYGTAAVMVPITYLTDAGFMKRLFEAWWGEWNIILMSCVLGLQIFIWLPNDYYLDNFPWEVMFVYISNWLIHLVVYFSFRF